MFIEVPATFYKGYTKEEKKEFSLLYSDESEWPEKEEKLDNLVINTDHIVTFFESKDPDKTTVTAVADAEGFLVNMSYGDFKFKLNQPFL